MQPARVTDPGRILFIGIVIQGGQFITQIDEWNTADGDDDAMNQQHTANGKVKISIINDLKSQQKVPVRVMDEVSAALPALVWLTRMDDKKGTLVIAGRALNTNAVATFIESLDQVEFFDEPVLKNTQQRAGVYNFVINVKFTRPPEPGSDRAAEGGV